MAEVKGYYDRTAGAKRISLATPEKKDHYLFFARPLQELYTTCSHRRLPSFELLARVIKVLVLSIFRWHLCDQILLARGNGEMTLYDNGRVNTVRITEPTETVVLDYFRIKFKRMRWCAHIVKCPPTKGDSTAKFPHINLNPVTLCEYFKARGVELIQENWKTKLFGISIYDLLHSPQLKAKTYAQYNDGD